MIDLENETHRVSLSCKAFLINNFQAKQLDQLMNDKNNSE